MNKKLHSWARCLLVIAIGQTSLAMADPARQWPEACAWSVGQGMKHHRRDLGTLYVPRDAKVGTVIGSIDSRHATYDPAGYRIQCMNRGNVLLEWDARATAPIFPGPLDPINGEDVTGKILQTNIPGVGVRIKLNFPFNGIADNSFHPVGGPATVPYYAVNDHKRLLTYISISFLNNSITLVKTGPLPAGAHQLNGSELFSGTLSDLGKVITFGLTGTIIQAQCSVSGNPVSADPVQLGEWDTTDFTGPGYTTTAVPFTVTLSACETDTSGEFEAMANIRLDGVRGSMPVGPTSSGVFSLTSDSDAQGMGIQILKSDGITPMALSEEVPLIAISPGNTVLGFNARFYQTGASHAVRPGIAKGALSFTVTYK
jgi:type 1 fimbria pilin